MTRWRPNVFGGAILGAALRAVGRSYFVSSSRPWPSGVRIIAISDLMSSRPTTRSAQRPSTDCRPSNPMPSSTKNAIAASRSSTTIATLSIRWIAMPRA